MSYCHVLITREGIASSFITYSKTLYVNTLAVLVSKLNKVKCDETSIGRGKHAHVNLRIATD